MPNVMAALEKYRWCPLLKMTRNETSEITLAVARRKVWLTPTARVPCSNASNIGQRKTWTQSDLHLAEFRQGARAPKMYI